MNTTKNLSSTTKKVIISVIIVVAILAILFIGVSLITRTMSQNNSIGEANAKNFAFADAGVDPVSVESSRADFDFEDGQFVYEVEFVVGNTQYEYVIKASDGSVLKKQTEVIGTNGANGQNADISAQITMDKAKEIALADLGLNASQVTFVKEKLDYDDGVAVYELEFYHDNVEYEYEINANTGAIYSKSKDAVAKQPNANANTNVNNGGVNNKANKISLDEAKNKALKDAGLSASQVTFTKTKQDYDDGITVYEIEFHTSTQEYEYEINAATGQIYSRDIEAFKNR